MSVRRPILLSAMLLASGCAVSTQLGAECVLVRKATPEEQTATGRNSINIKESELVAGQDYVSFGALDCDQLELTCVRDANHPRKTALDSPDAATTDALGYCSQACAPNASTCEATDTGVAKGLEGRTLDCRSLALDQKALEQLKKDDPVTYQKTFGDNSSAYFCAAPLSTQPQD